MVGAVQLTRVLLLLFSQVHTWDIIISKRRSGKINNFLSGAHLEVDCFFFELAMSLLSNLIKTEMRSSPYATDAIRLHTEIH